MLNNDWKHITLQYRNFNVTKTMLKATVGRLCPQVKSKSDKCKLLLEVRNTPQAFKFEIVLFPSFYSKFIFSCKGMIASIPNSSKLYFGATSSVRLLELMSC